MIEDKRINPTMSESDMYKISDIDSFIEHEQRAEERERLHEVKLQKATWLKTMLFCLLLNLAFFTLGIIGLFYKG